MGESEQGLESTIEINIKEKKIYSEGQVIATIQTLPSGELKAISLDGLTWGHFCVTKDRDYLFAESGGIWQKTRIFKEDWKKQYGENAPLPFKEEGSIFRDSDEESKNFDMTRAMSKASDGPMDDDDLKQNKQHDAMHLERMEHQFQSILRVEWFPAVSHAIIAELKEAGVVDGRTYSCATSNDQYWSPQSLKTVEDHIHDPNEERKTMIAVAAMAGILAK